MRVRIGVSWRKPLLACALAAALAPVDAAAARARAVSGQSPLGAVQQRYLALAEAGVRQAARHWGDRRRGWYDGYLGGRERYPLATIWGIVPLFESLDAIAIASPTAANRAAVERFAKGAERYLNRGLRPLAGFSPYPGDREPSTETWFDDNGWWGLAFAGAYRATGRHRYLSDAMQALRYIATVGWDPAGGGIWWNTTHPYKAGEALASATALAAELYQQTRSAFALAQAQRFLIWANGPGFSPADGLYARSNVDSTPIDYIEGPLIYANELLCRLGAEPGGCARAEQLKATALHRFGHVLDFSPQYDAIYLQWMLALYSLDSDPALYSLAADNAAAAREHALDSRGLYLRSWTGEALPAAYALPNQLQTQAATTSVFAWLAVYPPPAG
jgi:Glycosyl hydrolase family 76